MTMTSSEEARPCGETLTKPCHDCPWRRAALPGWLGSLSPDEWVQIAHSEATAACHAFEGPQCAGLAIYRANVLKSPRDPEALRLPQDREAVFTNPGEFIGYHAAAAVRKG